MYPRRGPRLRLVCLRPRSRSRLPLRAGAICRLSALLGRLSLMSSRMTLVECGRDICWPPACVRVALSPSLALHVHHTMCVGWSLVPGETGVRVAAPLSPASRWGRRSVSCLQWATLYGGTEARPLVRVLLVSLESTLHTCHIRTHSHTHTLSQIQIHTKSCAPRGGHPLSISDSRHTLVNSSHTTHWPSPATIRAHMPTPHRPA